MKKLFVPIVALSLLFTACKENKKDKVVVSEEVEIEEVAVLDNVNLESSVIMWEGAKPTGTHNGTISLQQGSLIIDEGTLKGGEFVVDMSSIVVLDIPADDEGNGKLTGHLNSPDFFDVATYPTSKFVITNVEDKGDKVHVTGNLTMKDVTKSITIPAMLMMENGVTTFKSEPFNVDRTDFGITYKSKKIDAALKDQFINDLMELSFEVKTKS